MSLRACKERYDYLGLSTIRRRLKKLESGDWIEISKLSKSKAPQGRDEPQKKRC